MRPHRIEYEQMFEKMIDTQLQYGNYQKAEQYLDEVRVSLSEKTINRLEKKIKCKEKCNEDETKI